MSRIKDITGRKYGKWTVLKCCGMATSKDRTSLWLCQCECGNTAIVRRLTLTRGSSKSCGKHDKIHDELYKAWSAMKSRCYNAHNKSYRNYGGRGIEICEEWKKDFEAFRDYVKVLPHYGEEERTLDRINNDGNYEPGNVRWATKVEQSNNRRNTIRVNLDGEEMPLIQVAEKYGIPRGTLYKWHKNKNLEKKLSEITQKKGEQ